MASYWKSNTRYFCDICKCWLADNRASIEFHERGKSHKDKKEKHLTQLRKQSAEQYKNQQQAGVFLRQMEDAALQAYKKDLAAQGLVIDGEMPNLASSRPNSGIHELHFPNDDKKKKVKIHNAEDMRESKILQNSSWVKQVSPEGRGYYWNSDTGKSQWDKPEELKESKKESVDLTKEKPGGSGKNKRSEKSPWQKQVSPDGDIYYWNSETGKTQWDKPEDFLDTDKKSGKKDTEDLNKSETKSSWTEEESPEGHTYYWNSQTGKSQWEKPKDFVESKLSFTPVQTNGNDDDSAELPVKKPKHNPYGSWSVVREVCPRKQVDWQLPSKPENSAAEGLLDRTSLEQPPEPEPAKFNEKIVTSLGGEGGSTTFKKKTAKQRSIRKRNNDD